MCRLNQGLFSAGGGHACKGGWIPGGQCECGGVLVELGDFRGGEEQAAGGIGAVAGGGFDLTGKHGGLVAVAEDVGNDGGEVLG